ncbi:RNase III inhibitor [Klebsiella pneumoniae subsp. pneumoniae]|uniref:RNase III inhibitor n=1 Tax=Klebsiella pneumoniae subsp. pneumoniae TaxID=72407 RepID=A0A377ZZE9_KLEPN|nr:RNase III inhibitor [Klebsiella pneumoniae subsp. pneumoniae]
MAVKPEVILGDITTLDVDVIVNAANPRCWVVAE